MRQPGTVALLGVGLLLALTIGRTPAAAQYDGYAYPPPGWSYALPESLDRIGDVLKAIDSPSRRSTLAENWLQFSKTAIAKNLELQQDWVDVQRAQVRQNQQAGQLRLQMAQLQLQIEQLHAANLQLERENLQLRLSLQKQAAASGNAPPATAEPNESVGAGVTGESAPRMPPAEPQ